MVVSECGGAWCSQAQAVAFVRFELAQAHLGSWCSLGRKSKTTDHRSARATHACRASQLPVARGEHGSCAGSGGVGEATHPPSLFGGPRARGCGLSDDHVAAALAGVVRACAGASRGGSSPRGKRHEAGLTNRAQASLGVERGRVDRAVALMPRLPLRGAPCYPQKHQDREQGA